MNSKTHESLFLRFKKAISPNEWKAGLLGLPKSHYSSAEPGLVMIQIDGFSKEELEKALEREEMPFLKKLLSRENYKLYSLYPGLPSTTPSVQGELFYGIKQSVPAFFFFDKESQKVFKMFDGESVREMEQRLKRQGPGLLQGGSSYSNIYTGGAAESHFCAGSLGWQYIWKDINIGNFILLLLTHFVVLLRMMFLVLWETLLALMDFIYGLIKREDLEVEFRFVPIRVLICILLRELVTLGAIIDTSRGLPIIHLNFLGFDEQAHRRGPSSQTAHWALKGIDKSIARIYKAAIGSPRRHYDVWVYSDHGQEATIPYVGFHGKSVEAAVSQVYAGMFPNQSSVKINSEFRKYQGIEHQRVRYLGHWAEKIWPINNGGLGERLSQCITAAMGPLGHVYVFHDLSHDEKEKFAFELVHTAKIPLVLTIDENHHVWARNHSGIFHLPEDAGKIIDARHPFFKDIVADLMAICRHPNAGSFIISGWEADAKPFSFPFENGAHAGPGKKETDAFALLPAGIITLPQDRPYLKVLDLRESAARLIKREDISNNISNNPAIISESVKKTIRLMTYNVHSCIGMDGKISPQRIARIIGQYEPDIVTLQELDLGRKRTYLMDQPHLIAKELEMLFHFHPSIQVEEEKYGNAVLSRYPMDLVCAMKLPKLESRLDLEPRGALWTSIDIGGNRLQIITTHLSLYGPECLHQAKALMSPDWIGHSACKFPAILCGDFNCLPHSAPWRILYQGLDDAQLMLDDHRALPTWCGHYPIGRIDHVFISPGIKITGITVPQAEILKLASDHLPLIVDFEIVEGEIGIGSST